MSSGASAEGDFKVESGESSSSLVSPGAGAALGAVSRAASTKTVSAWQSFTFAGITISKTTVRITCYGADTEVEASATVQLRQGTIPASDTGNAFDGDWTTYTADESGVVDLTLWSGAEYSLRRGAAGPITKFTPTGASYSVSSIVGKSV